MRFSVLPLALLAPVLSYYQPGDPPQCFDEYQCVFNRFPSELNGLTDEYTWDLRSLCAGAGAEYTATRDPQCNLPDGSTPCPTACLGNCAVNQDQKPVIVFNICGTVNGPIAPVSETDGTGGVGDPQTIPIPHSHGVALQVSRPLGGLCGTGRQKAAPHSQHTRPPPTPHPLALHTVRGGHCHCAPCWLRPSWWLL
jgi:hypothetical protein